MLNAVCLNCGIFGHFKARCPSAPAYNVVCPSSAVGACSNRGKVLGASGVGNDKGWRFMGKKRWIPVAPVSTTAPPATGIPDSQPVCPVLLSRNPFEALVGVEESSDAVGSIPVSGAGFIDGGEALVSCSAAVVFSGGGKVSVEEESASGSVEGPEVLPTVECASGSVEGPEECAPAGSQTHVLGQSMEHCSAVLAEIQKVEDKGGQQDPVNIVLFDNGPGSPSAPFTSPINSLGHGNSGLKRGFLGPNTRSKALASSSSFALDPGLPPALLGLDGPNNKQKAKKLGVSGARPRDQ